jgi:hypothetical protein
VVVDGDDWILIAADDGIGSSARGRETLPFVTQSGFILDMVSQDTGSA